MEDVILQCKHWFHTGKLVEKCVQTHIATLVKRLNTWTQGAK